MTSLILFAVCVVVIAIGFTYASEFLICALYRTLFGILYRNVSETYADPISFLLSPILYFSMIGLGIILAVQ